MKKKKMVNKKPIGEAVLLEATPVLGKMLLKKKIDLEVNRLAKLLRYGWAKETQGQRHQVYGAMEALRWALNGATGDWIPHKPLDFKRNKRPLRYTMKRGKNGMVVKIPRFPTVL